MQTIINWTKSPIVVEDENGDRITIPAGKERPVAGDFSNHPWVLNHRLTVTTQDYGEYVDDGDDIELEELRQQYQNIFNKKPHKNAKADTLRQKIEEWREGKE